MPNNEREDRIRICIEVPASALIIENRFVSTRMGGEKTRSKYDMNRLITRELGQATREGKCLSLDELIEKINPKDEKETDAFNDAFNYLSKQGAIYEERRNCFKLVERERR